MATSAAAADPPRHFSLFPAVAEWNLALKSALETAPALRGSRGYFALEGDRLAAYDIEHGTLLWLAQAHPRWPAEVGDDLVFLVEPGRLTALRDDTGAVAWRVPIPEEIAAPLVWHAGWLVATAASGTVFALRARDGGLIWRQDLGTPIHGKAALAADRVYVPLSDGRLVALRVETGEHVWERRLGGAPNEVLALDDELFAGSEDKYFYAIRASNGDVLWRWPTGGDVVGLPVVDDRRVYFVSFDNVLRGLDRKNGAQRWKSGLPLRPTRGPVALGDTILVSGVSTYSFAYFVKDGRSAGRIESTGELATAPHVIEGTALPSVVVVTRDLEQGTWVGLWRRGVDPDVSPIAPLPNPIIPPIPVERRPE